MLLLSDMINTRTYIRLLKRLGVALIFAPEPFTTPFGVASILVARHLSKRHEASVNNRLRETVQYYLAHTGRFGEYVDGESAAPSRAKRRGLNEERPILGEITGSRSVQAKSSVRHGRPHTHGGTANHTTDTESPSRRYKYGDSLSGTSTGTQRVIHHTIDMEWLSRRYESANGAVAHSGWATTSGAGEGITHHSIEVGSLPQNCRSGSVGQTKAKSHAVNIAQRRLRYGSAVSYTTVARALRNNNFNYDILSRRNVIGGY
jgi:hypothetical protein